MESAFVPLATSIAMGGVVGLVRAVMTAGGLRLPRTITTDDGGRLAKLGFIGSVLISSAAAGIAVCLGMNTASALLASYAGPDFFESLSNMKVMRNGVNGGTKNG